MSESPCRLQLLTRPPKYPPMRLFPSNLLVTRRSRGPPCQHWDTPYVRGSLGLLRRHSVVDRKGYRLLEREVDQHVKFRRFPEVDLGVACLAGSGGRFARDAAGLAAAGLSVASFASACAASSAALAVSRFAASLCRLLCCSRFCSHHFLFLFCSRCYSIRRICSRRFICCSCCCTICRFCSHCCL